MKKIESMQHLQAEKMFLELQNLQLEKEMRSNLAVLRSAMSDKGKVGSGLAERLLHDSTSWLVKKLAGATVGQIFGRFIK